MYEAPVEPLDAGAGADGGSTAAGAGGGGRGGAGGDGGRAGTGSGGLVAGSDGDGGAGGVGGSDPGDGAAGSLGGAPGDGGDASADSSDGGMVEACIPESAGQFCARLKKMCGSVTGNDNCGMARTGVTCGTCPSQQICNGSNACAMPVTITVDDAASGPGTNQWNFVSGGWNHGYEAACYGQSNSWDRTAGDIVTLAFVGVQISFYARVNDGHGICALSVDGGAESPVDLYATPAVCDDLVWTSATLPYGNHTFQLRVTGEKNAASTDAWCVVDRAVITQ